MLNIRREQMEVLSAYMRQSFEDRIMRHVAQSYPKEFRKLAPPASGEEPVRKLIRQGIEKAASYDITSERDVGRFIDLMVLLGPDFDTTPEASWAQAVLRDKATLPARARVELIHQQLAIRAGESPSGSDARAY